jgi:hypothetical protein
MRGLSAGLKPRGKDLQRRCVDRSAQTSGEAPLIRPREAGQMQICHVWMAPGWQGFF